VPAGAPEAAALAATAALWGAAFYAYYAATAEEVEVRARVRVEAASFARGEGMQVEAAGRHACRFTMLCRADIEVEAPRRGRGGATGKAALCNGRFRALHRGPRATAQVVDAAVANADRYYRLVAMGMASRSGDAEWEAALFKAAAAAWLAEKKANSRLNALLQIFEACGHPVVISNPIPYPVSVLRGLCCRAVAVSVGARRAAARVPRSCVGACRPCACAEAGLRPCVLQRCSERSAAGTAQLCAFCEAYCTGAEGVLTLYQLCLWEAMICALSPDGCGIGPLYFANAQLVPPVCRSHCACGPGV